MKQRILVVACFMGAFVGVAALFWNYSSLPLFVAIPIDVFRSAKQRQALQSRQDYPEIAASCVTLARSVTDDGNMVEIPRQRFPAVLRSLGARSVFASPDQVTVEFHGAFDHYGYLVRRSEGNPKEWTISWYTETEKRLFTTISND